MWGCVRHGGSAWGLQLYEGHRLQVRGGGTHVRGPVLAAMYGMLYGMLYGMVVMRGGCSSCEGRRLQVHGGDMRVLPVWLVPFHAERHGTAWC